MLVPAALSAVLFTPIVTSAAASLSPSLSPVVALLQLGTISGHPHRRQSSSSISFGGQSISLACEPTCASTAPTLAICEAKLDNNGCNAICNDLESYAQCINCVLLNDQGTGRNITEEVYQSSVMGNEFLVSSTWNTHRHLTCTHTPGLTPPLFPPIDCVTV